MPDQTLRTSRPKCCPVMTLGCNDIAGDAGFCGCPYCAVFGNVEPLKRFTCIPTCRGGENMSACINCGCPIATPCCLLCYFPLCLVSYMLPKGCLNIGPPCWGCFRLDSLGGKGYERDEWYDE